MIDQISLTQISSSLVNQRKYLVLTNLLASRSGVEPRSIGELICGRSMAVRLVEEKAVMPIIFTMAVGSDWIITANKVVSQYSELT